MPVVEIIFEVLELIRRVHALCETIEEGCTSCKFLSGRIVAFIEPLNKIQSSKDSQNDSVRIRAVQNLQNVLTECEKFIKNFQGKGWHLRIMFAQSDVSTFKELNQKLSTIAMVTSVLPKTIPFNNVIFSF
jgi:16S rRNA G527 N7-methylase RsmG